MEHLGNVEFVLHCICDLNVVEDEYHFILECPTLADFREKFIKPFYYRRPSVYKLVQLLSTKNTKLLVKLSKYLLNATERRKTRLP